MAKFNIANEFKEPVLDLINFNEDKIDILCKILNDYILIENQDNILLRIQNELKINKENAKGIYELLDYLLRMRYRYSNDNDIIISSIIDNIKQKKWQESIIEEQIKIRINKILQSLYNFAINVKSKYLEYLREKILTNIKIITDIRPVFGETDKPEIDNVLINTLVIEYFESGVTKQLHLAIDDKDLNEMVNIAKITADKNNLLMKHLNKTNMNILIKEKE